VDVRLQARRLSRLSAHEATTAGAGALAVASSAQVHSAGRANFARQFNSLAASGGVAGRPGQGSPALKTNRVTSSAPPIRSSGPDVQSAGAGGVAVAPSDNSQVAIQPDRFPGVSQPSGSSHTQPEERVQQEGWVSLLAEGELEAMPVEPVNDSASMARVAQGSHAIRALTALGAAHTVGAQSHA